MDYDFMELVYRGLQARYNDLVTCGRQVESLARIALYGVQGARLIARIPLPSDIDLTLTGALSNRETKRPTNQCRLHRADHFQPLFFRLIVSLSIFLSWNDRSNIFARETFCHISKFSPPSCRENLQSGNIDFRNSIILSPIRDAIFESRKKGKAKKKFD